MDKGQAGQSERALADQLIGRPPLWIQTEEDVAVVARGLGAMAKGTILCIASGGDTPIELVRRGAGRVIAVDINPTQIAVAQLKAAAIGTLDFAAFAHFWLDAPAPARLEIYEQLRPHLEGAARAALDEWLPTTDLSLPLVDQGVMQGVGSAFVRGHPAVAARVGIWLDSPSVADQLNYFEAHLQELPALIAAARQARAERWFGDADGERPNDNDAVSCQMQEEFKERFRRMVATIPVRRNPYLCHMLLGNYRPAARLPYMTAAGFRDTKRALSRLTFAISDTGSAISALGQGSIDAADLSNIADLLGPGEANLLFERLAATMRQGGRVTHRNLIWEAPYPPIPAFRRLEAQSARLTFADRSFLYSRVTVDQRR